MQNKNTSEFLNNRDKNELENLAETVAESVSSKGIVNLEQIAENNGISFSYGNYGDAFDGLLEHLGGRFHIYINIDRLEHGYTDRARFTFAHELGHYFIDNHRNALKQGLVPSHPSFTGFASNKLVERQADFFASCLLLPRTRIEKDCYGRNFSFSLVRELSKKYQSSLTATAIRYAALNLYPILIIYSVGNQIKWYWSTKDFPFKYLKHGKDRVPKNTVAGEYLLSKIRYAEPEIVFAKDWFKVIYREDYAREFYEQCVYGFDSVLSILWED